MRTFIIRVINIVLVVVAITGYNFVVESRDAADETARLKYEAAQQKENPQSVESKFTDGVFNGEGTGFGGTVSVDVTVINGEISQIDIIASEGEDAAYLEMAKDMIPEMLENQTANVDTISGATFSSSGIKEAVEAALEEAEAIQ
ncbi:MAG: FMN-binding protein [Suipraeoptans sp.]